MFFPFTLLQKKLFVTDLISQAPYFKAYASYCNNYDAAIQFNQTLLQANTEWRQIVEVPHPTTHEFQDPWLTQI